MATILDRVKIRLKDDTADTELLEELIQTTKDRINLRVGEDEFPPALDSIAVEVAVKSFRRIDFEGISSENADSISTSFVADIIAEHALELDAYKESKSGRRVVKFI